MSLRVRGLFSRQKVGGVIQARRLVVFVTRVAEAQLLNEVTRGVVGWVVAMSWGIAGLVYTGQVTSEPCSARLGHVAVDLVPHHHRH